MARPWKMTFLDFRQQVDVMFEELIYRRWAVARPDEWQPPLDLHETPDTYLVEIDLPNVPPDEVVIVLEERKLTVSGQRQATRPDAAVANRCERRCGPFRRSLDLPQPVDVAKTQAEYHHGTYRFWLPKKRTDTGGVSAETAGTGAAVRIVVREHGAESHHA
jgi:HSP20 family protein